METIITTDSGTNPRVMDNMVPCTVIDGNGNNYCDMRKIDSNKKVINNSEVLERAVSGERFHTASPTIGDYDLIMRKHLNKGCNIIHLSMSNGISAGSVNASRLIGEILNDEYGDDRVTVIDTLTAGCGGTVINDYANDLVKQGLPTKEIVKRLEEVKSKILATFYISKVEGFANSGRAPKEVKLSDKLAFRYRVDINDKGKLFPKLPIYRGNIKDAFMKYLKRLINENNVHEFDPNYLAFLITRLDEINLEEAKDYIRSLNYFKEENIQELEFYSAICSYGVIDQVGIGLIKK